MRGRAIGAPHPPSPRWVGEGGLGGWEGGLEILDIDAIYGVARSA